MAVNITLFAQAIATLPKKIIKGIISKCNSDKFCKGFDTWSQLVSMIFCQFANSTSVRDISNRGAAQKQPLVQKGAGERLAPCQASECAHRRDCRTHKPANNRKIPQTVAACGRLQRGEGFTIELLTNNFNWAASTIGELYKSRWLVAIFFRHVKQLLHIKSFVGTSQDVVEIQLWTSMITILMLKYLRFKASYDWNLSNLVASLCLNTFTKMDLWKWLNKPFTPPPDTLGNPNEGVQLSIF